MRLLAVPILLAALAISESGHTCQAIQVQPGSSTGPFAGPSALSIFEQRDLFVSGQLGVHTFRKPALCSTNSGILIAVCDARQDDASELPGNIDLVMRRSTDLGATWDPVTYIQDLPTDNGVGDASLLVDRVTGRVFCFFVYAPPGIGWSNSQAGSNSSVDPNTLHAHVIWSDDEGQTWSPPLDLNPQIKSTSWRALSASSGNGIQTRSGRLIQPFAILGAAGTSHARNVYSDDHGLNWMAGSRVADEVTESEVAEKNDGRIVQNLRHDTKTARIVASSIDGGTTFGPSYQHPFLVDPLVNAGLLVHSAKADGDPEDIWLFSNPANTTGRSHLTVQVGYDEGKSFDEQRIVHHGPADYSTMALLADGTVGLLYERGNLDPHEAVTFARFDLGWILERPDVVRASGTPRHSHPNLWAWFDAGHSNTLNGPGRDLNGDPVSLWKDRGSAGVHDLVRSNDGLPVLEVGVANGHPAVAFTGDVDLWGAAATSSEFQTPSPGITVLLVARVDSVASPGYLFDHSSNAGGVGLRASPAGTGTYELHIARSTNGPAIDLVIPSGPIQLGSFEVHTLTLGNEMLIHHIGGSLEAAWNFANGGLPVLQAGLVLGADVGTGNEFEGALAEFLAYDEVLPEPDRVALEAYLRSKYGL